MTSGARFSRSVRRSAATWYHVSNIRRPLPPRKTGTLEDDLLGDVDCHGFRRQAERRETATEANGFQTLIDGLRIAAHFDDHVHAVPVRSPLQFTDNVVLQRIEGHIGSHTGGQVQAVRIHIDGDNKRGSRGLGNGGGAKARWPAPENRHTCGGNGFNQRRENGVAEGLLCRSQVRRKVRVVHPDVVLGNRYIFGETAVGIHAQYLDVRQVWNWPFGIEASSAYDVGLRR